MQKINITKEIVAKEDIKKFRILKKFGEGLSQNIATIRKSWEAFILSPDFTISNDDSKKNNQIATKGFGSMLYDAIK